MYLKGVVYANESVKAASSEQLLLKGRKLYRVDGTDMRLELCPNRGEKVSPRGLPTIWNAELPLSTVLTATWLTMTSLFRGCTRISKNIELSELDCRRQFMKGRRLHLEHLNALFSGQHHNILQLIRRFFSTICIHSIPFHFIPGL